MNKYAVVSGAQIPRDPTLWNLNLAMGIIHTTIIHALSRVLSTTATTAATATRNQGILSLLVYSRARPAEEYILCVRYFVRDACVSN